MRLLLLLLMPAGLAACAAPAERSGLLTSYEGLSPRSGSLRASIAEGRDDAALAAVERIALSPAVMAERAGGDWMNEAERTALLREVDAQLCFELSRRYAIAGPGEAPDARVRSVVSAVKPSGRVGAAPAVAAAYFVPGPIGFRLPGTLGGLAAEAEMLGADGRQLAAVTYSRQATAVGTDNPSFSRIGDALQFAEPFADVAAEALSPEGADRQPVPDPDPCAEYGPRFRVEGFATRFATGLYVPQVSAARPAAAPEPEAPPATDMEPPPVPAD